MLAPLLPIKRCTLVANNISTKTTNKTRHMIAVVWACLTRLYWLFSVSNAAASIATGLAIDGTARGKTAMQSLNGPIQLRRKPARTKFGPDSQLSLQNLLQCRRFLSKPTTLPASHDLQVEGLGGPQSSFCANIFYIFQRVIENTPSDYAREMGENA